MQDRPTAAELVQAIGTFLEADIIPTLTDARLKFRTRIAVNVLAIVARELAAGDAALSEERRRLADLLGPVRDDEQWADSDRPCEVDQMNRAFAARVRRGTFDDPGRFQEALAVAEAALVVKLRITNPRYLARIQEESA